jgi:hypothetical protein
MRRNPYIIVISMLILVSLFGSGCTLTVCTAPEILVTRTDDASRGLCSLTSCSLRQAITASNICIGEQTIRIPTGTYILTAIGAREDNNRSGDLDIIDSVNIVTVGMPVIDGNNSDRVFDIKAPASVQMTELIIQNGQEQWGGGIMNAGTLFASKVLIQGNHDSIGGSAAGVYNSGNATFTHSAIVNNISFEETGGVQSTGRLKLDNVTVSGNHGYGVMNEFASGFAEVVYSTIANNPGAYEIWNGAAPENFKISNSIVAGHVSDGNCFQPLTSTGFNIDTSSPASIQNCGLTQPTDLNEVNPNLLPLGSYGGLTPSRALDISSPALDSADPAVCGGSDQRGVGRPQGPGCDRGSFELDDVNPNPNAIRPTATPTVTPLPTEGSSSGSFILTVEVPANCRQGPGVVYPVVDSVPAGGQVQVIGKSADGTWWYSQLKNDKCFISNIAGTPLGDLSLLTIIPAPPLPVATEPPPEEEPEPTDEVIVDPDNDGDGYPFSNDCDDKNAKINPGAVETPDDKVDSNCNGDDDK